MPYGYSVKDTDQKTAGNIHEECTIRKLVGYKRCYPFLSKKPKRGAQAPSQRYP